MTVPLLQAEPGFTVTSPNHVFLAGAVVNTLSGGLVITTPPEVFLAARRSSSMPGGIILDNLTIVNADTQAMVPGFALTKGLRVMTLVDNKVMAFRNVVD